MGLPLILVYTMKILARLALSLGLVTCVYITGCGGSSSGTQAPPPASSPTVSSISPTTVPAGSGSLSLTVNGTGFVKTTTIQVGSVADATTYVSSTQVTATVTTAQLASGSQLSVVAFNGTASSGSGSAVNLQVTNPVPTISQFAPTVLTVGAATPILSVTGTGYVPTTTINVNGSARPTTFVSSTQVSVTLNSSDVAAAGNLSLTAVNAAPGGGTSSAAQFQIFPAMPTPVITQLFPSQFVVGSSDTTITVYGSNLVTQLSSGPYVATVLWNGTPLTTVNYFIGNGGTSINAQVPASLLTSAQTVSITVSSAISAPSTSNALAIPIVNPPPPTVIGISPSAGPLNTATSITLNGTNFTSQSTIALNGVNIPATFVNPGQLTATIPASAALLPGNLNLTVTTPAPGGGTSAPLTYTAYIGIANNSMVFNPANGLLYVSVPSSAGPPYGNSVVSVDPETGALGTPILVGSEPDKLAITSDGHYLWVGLDGASAVRKVDLTTGTAGLQFSFGGNSGIYANPPVALALAALPGAPDSVVVATNGDYSTQALGIYDSGVLRGTAIANFLNSANALQTNSAKSEIYAAGQGTYTVYGYSASGLTQKSTASNGTYVNYGNDDLQVIGGRAYTDLGTVYDAEAGALLGTFYSSGNTPATGPVVADTTLNKAFVLDSSQIGAFGTYNQIQSFNTSDYTSTRVSIPVNVPAPDGNPFTGPPSHLTRWGTNGLAFRNSLGVFSLRSNAVKDLTNVSADLEVTLAASGASTTGTNTTYTATITNNGPSAATNIALTGQAPSTGTLISTTPAAGTCSISAGLSCNLGGLASGAKTTVAMVVTQTTAGAATASVQVSGSESDPTLSNNQASSTQTITGSTYNLTPSLVAISPTAIETGSSDTVITVTGSGFTNSSSVLLGNTLLSTSYSSSTQLTATVPESALAAIGWQSITVSNPTPGGGVSRPLPLSFYSVITLGANHIIYDPYSRKIMASVGSGSSTVTGNSIVAITPDTATIGTAVPIGSQPTNLALTSDGQILYTILSGSQNVARFNMVTQQADFTFPIPNNSSFDGGIALRGIAAQPGTENTIALDIASFTGNAIYDVNPNAKSAAIRGQASGPYSGSCITFLDAGDMLAFDTDTSGATLDHYTVTSAGFTYYNYQQYSESTLNGFGCFKLSGGLAFGNAGGVANPATVPATQMGVFPVTGGGEFSTSTGLAPDTSLQEAFFLVNTGAGTTASYGTIDGIRAFDQNTFLPSANVFLNMEAIEGNTSFSGLDLIRWGQDGLAVLTSSGHIYLLRGAFVVPQLLNHNSAASLASSSGSTIAHGTGNTVLTLTGTHFVPGVAVTWNGDYRTTTIVDSTHVTVAIPASDLANTGSASLVATNPGASASNTLTVTID